MATVKYLSLSTGKMYDKITNIKDKSCLYNGDDSVNYVDGETVYNKCPWCETCKKNVRKEVLILTYDDNGHCIKVQALQWHHHNGHAFRTNEWTSMTLEPYDFNSQALPSTCNFSEEEVFEN